MQTHPERAESEQRTEQRGAFKELSRQTLWTPIGDLVQAVGDRFALTELSDGLYGLSPFERGERVIASDDRGRQSRDDGSQHVLEFIAVEARRQLEDEHRELILLQQGCRFTSLQ